MFAGVKEIFSKCIREVLLFEHSVSCVTCNHGFLLDHINPLMTNFPII